ncbi:MAG: hypothetical protein QXU40_01670 [Candidatus Pacearchaeota archaeon]
MNLNKKEGNKKQKKTPSSKAEEINKELLDNFIALQKVMVNLTKRIDNLSIQISRLFELFEVAAKSLVKRDLEKEERENESKKILEKLETISKQASLIGRGIALIHEVNTKGLDHYPYQTKETGSAIPPRGTPSSNIFGKGAAGFGETYQKSILNKTKDEQEFRNSIKIEEEGSKEKFIQKKG